LARGAAVLLSLAMTVQMAVPASAQEDDCLKCHKALANVKDGHAGLKGGCKTCHAATDASTVPHKTTGNVASGLSASQPALCVSCHDKPKFTKANRHSAPAKGCTGCHTAHVSKEEKLLKSEVPALCYSCHEESLFKAKFRHRPVARGACLDCHDAHSTEHPVMLITAIEVICLECHSEVKEQPHLVAGFSNKGHPLGDEKTTTPAADPLRPGKQFYCGSCHQPHKADFPKLNRLDPSSTTFCQRCHEK
jgi:predicted CXXCH cytochrome family protein